MKSILYQNRIIPEYSINSIEINEDAYNNYSIVIRQVNNYHRLITSNDKEYICSIFEKLKNEFNCINFNNVVKEVENDKNNTKNLVENKPKVRKRKVSDNNDREK